MASVQVEKESAIASSMGPLMATEEEGRSRVKKEWGAKLCSFWKKESHSF